VLVNGRHLMAEPPAPKQSSSGAVFLHHAWPRCACRDVKALFTDWRHGFYQHNKLANVYTAFEMQRRCAAACRKHMADVAAAAASEWQLASCAGMCCCRLSSYVCVCSLA
jgi:hypothetical protein